MSGKNAVIVEVPNSQSERVKALERQLAEQQALLGRMAVKMDLQERLIDLYEEEMPEFKKKLLHRRQPALKVVVLCDMGLGSLRPKSPFVRAGLDGC